MFGGRFLVDPYLDWAAEQGLPIAEDFCVDLNLVETRYWPRMEANVGFVHLKGRGDYISMFVIEVPPGKKTSPQKHLYEEIFYVLSGYGLVTFEDSKGAEHTFEFGPRSLFALPLNTRYRIFNGSGREPTRLASTNNFAMMMKLFRKESFIFDNPATFEEREGPENYFTGSGSEVATHTERSMWETNFIPDMDAFKLTEWATRGAGSATMVFAMAEATMHAHCSEMSVGTYKKAHRHGTDFHVCIVGGHGYSLFWYEHEKDFRRYDWREGCVFAPTDMVYHQHFNTSSRPARYLATAFGSGRYPFTEEKRLIKMGVNVSVKKDGGRQIEYEDQDPRIHSLYLDELRKNGVECRMSSFMDETIFSAKQLI